LFSGSAQGRAVYGRNGCRNDHEIIQLLISRGHVVDHPHAIYCECTDCQQRQSADSLKRSLSRLHAYKALSSPTFMALSSSDPITTTFELRQEMMQVAEVEKEFKVRHVVKIDRPSASLYKVKLITGCSMQVRN